MTLVLIQESFGRKLHGDFLWGLEFRCALANLYGVKRTFYTPGERGDIPKDYPRNPYETKIRGFHKTDRFRMESRELLYFIRLYPSAIEDLISFILDLERGRFSPHSQSSSVKTVREGMKIILMGLSPNRWWSLSEAVVYKGESWM